MYNYWIMIADSTYLKLNITAKGNSVIGKYWRGQSQDERYARIYYIVDGTATIIHHGRKFDMKPGYFYLIPPGSNMRNYCRASFEVIWFHFNISLYGDMDLFQFSSFKFMEKPEDKTVAKNKMLQLLDLTERNDIFSQLKAKSLLLDLIAPFFKFQQQMVESDSSKERFARLAPVLEYIESNISKKIGISELAKLAAYEKSYFSVLFKETFSVSPKRYILKKRIEKAQVLLRNTDMKLETIAVDMGFVDAFHLSKTFKKITGETPREFRRKFLYRIP